MDDYGTAAAWGFPANFFGMRPQPPTMAGSNLGLPPTAGIAGQTDANAGALSAVSTAQQVATKPAQHQPIFWLVVMMVIGVWILAHIAHVAVRG